ncbi:MAG: ABC transporter substrate-binding protein [Chloroflexi bacterium]|nr:ABC transporter substrate-binding protein [Chloroflexota bacterium]
MSKKINRRKFLGLSAAGAAGLIVASCAPAATPTPEIINKEVQIEVTRIVAGTSVVEQVVVTATPAPTSAPAAVKILGFSRPETVFAQQLTGRNATPSNFNYWAGWRQQDRGMQQVMNEPLWVDDFEKGEIINALASAPPEYSADFKTMTIKLRQGMFWSDNTEITADDLAFTVEFIKATPAASYNASLALQVESAKAADKYTAVIQLKQPNPRFHYENFCDLWGSLWVMPKHVFEKFMVNGTVDTKAFFAFEYNPPLSSGPYTLQSFDPAGNWTAWVKRDDWAKTPTGVVFGEPKPKNVVFVDYGDFTARVISMTRHEVDMIDLDLPAIRAVMKAEPTARGYYANQDFPWIQSNRHPGVGGVVFNTLKAPFNNKDVRWALNLAIDPVSYMTTAYDGCAAMNPLPIVVNAAQMKVPYIDPLVAWLTDLTIDVGGGEKVKVWDPTAPTRLVNEAIKRGFKFTTDPETIKTSFGYGSWQYAPDAAAKLLKKAGFSQSADKKWLLPSGQPFTFSVYTSDTPGRWAYQNAQAAFVEWKRFGFDVRFEVGDPGQLRMEMGQFDVGGTQTHGSNYLENPDLFRTFTAFNTSYLEPDLTKRQFGHPSRWTNKRVDEILNKIQVTNPTDTATLQPLGLEILQTYITEMPAISATTSLDPYAVSSYYWTGWPSAENHFIVPYHHYPNFKYLLTFLKPSGK